MRDITFGQYYPVQSIVHKLDARTKILLTIAYITIVFLIDNYIGYGVILLSLVAFVLLSRVPLKSVLKSVKGIIYLIVFTSLINLLFYRGEQSDLVFSWWIIKIYGEGIILASKMALRLLFLVLGPSLLTLTTTPIALTDGIESLLKPLTLIKFPVHEFAIIMSIALRLIPNLIEETDKIMAAQKARCAEFDSRNLFKKARAMLPILIPLFISSFRRADELAYAMDSRCYRGSVGRTKMKVLKYALRDAVAFLVFLTLGAAIVFLRYASFGWII